MREGEALRKVGFTLIEMMAVVVVIGLALGVVLPNLTASRGAQLEESAREIAARLEFARVRAIVTGAAHRAFLDLEGSSLRIDWHVSEERAFAHLEEFPESLGASQLANPLGTSSASRKISLSPPAREERDYFPVPNLFGNDEWLPPDIFFEGVNTPDGWVAEGSVQIVFQSDGSTDYAEVVLADAWENRVILEIRPLLESVRVLRAEES